MAKLKATTYTELRDLLPKPNTPRTIGNNTTAIFHQAGTGGYAHDRVEVRLHGHLIAVVEANHVEVTTAGWDTVTTRERLNHFLAPVNAGVGRHKGQLRITTRLLDDDRQWQAWDGSWFRVVAR